MKQTTEDLIYTARWHLLEAIKRNDHTLIDEAYDLIFKAKADLLTEDLPEEPERPSDPMPEKSYEIPKMVSLPGVKFNKQGNYRTTSGQAKGLVVHYTVSGRAPKSAKSVVNYLASKGLGCMVMDEDGTIYVPEGFNFLKDVAWHAGSSSWKGATGISRYCMGMEICCWGKDSKEGPYRESKGEDNIKAGKYQAYTEAQEKSLENFILWQLDTNKDFSIDWLVGHDEIAPNRKSDPGASLSVSMPEFRRRIEGLVN